jgi:hypothetical protein
VQDIRDRGPGNPEFVGQVAMSNAADNMSRADLDDGCLGQTCLRVTLTAGESSALRGLASVRSVRSKTQVRRLEACPSIAAVGDESHRRDASPMPEPPGHPVDAIQPTFDEHHERPVGRPDQAPRLRIASTTSPDPAERLSSATRHRGHARAHWLRVLVCAARPPIESANLNHVSRTSSSLVAAA